MDWDAGVFIAQRRNDASSIARVCCQTEAEAEAEACHNRGRSRGSAGDDSLCLELEDLCLATAAGSQSSAVVTILHAYT